MTHLTSWRNANSIEHAATGWFSSYRKIIVFAVFQHKKSSAGVCSQTFLNM